MGKIAEQFNKDSNNVNVNTNNKKSRNNTDRNNNENKDDSEFKIESKEQNIKIQTFTEKDTLNMIHEELLYILKEVNFKTDEYLNNNRLLDESIAQQVVTYRACAVIYVELVNQDLIFKLQTFRIVPYLQVNLLKTQILNFWGIGSDSSAINYYFLDNKMELIEVPSNKNDLTMEQFLKQQPNARDAVFICFNSKSSKYSRNKNFKNSFFYTNITL